MFFLFFFFFSLCLVVTWNCWRKMRTRFRLTASWFGDCEFQNRFGFCTKICHLTLWHQQVSRQSWGKLSGSDPQEIRLCSISSLHKGRKCAFKKTEWLCRNTLGLFLRHSSPSLADSLAQVCLLAGSAHISPLYSLTALFTRSLIQSYSRSFTSIRQHLFALSVYSASRCPMCISLYTHMHTHKQTRTHTYRGI